MKHTSRIPVSNYYKSQPVYPNAADTNYFSAKALEILTANGETAYLLGEIVKSDEGVILE